MTYKSTTETEEETLAGAAMHPETQHTMTPNVQNTGSGKQLPVVVGQPVAAQEGSSGLTGSGLGGVTEVAADVGAVGVT